MQEYDSVTGLPTGDMNTTPNTGHITIEDFDGGLDNLYLDGIVAIKASCLDTMGRVIELAILTRTDKESVLYRIGTHEVIRHEFSKFENHWQAAYDLFVRAGGHAGNMNPHPDPVRTTVIRVVK